MKQHIYTLLCVLGFLGTDLYGQYQKNPNALIVKKTFIDHFTPITGKLPKFEDLSGGWEIGFSRNLKGPLNIGIPLKLGVVKLPESNENLTTIGVDGILQLQFFKPKNVLNPYIFAGVGWVVEDFNLNQNYFQTPGGAGVNIKLSSAAFLNLQTEFRYTVNNQRNNIQYGMGLVFLLDKVREEKDPFEELKLAKKRDSDGDGLNDALDKCPFTAGPMMYNGCPDTDGDGIADPSDDCPTEFGAALAGGCPDKDNDGFSDLEDQCPEIAGTVFGCPDENKDGLIDGTSNAVPSSDEFVSKGGVLEVAKADLEILDMALKNVQFEIEKAKLKVNSLIYLDRVAEVLKKYPEYNLRISGYTDSSGGKAFNEKLSVKRAKTCFDYLVQYGIKKDRLEYKGYGEAYPIADNRSEEGRMVNRRVEFKLYY